MCIKNLNYNLNTNHQPQAITVFGVPRSTFNFHNIKLTLSTPMQRNVTFILNECVKIGQKNVPPSA